MTKAVIYPPRNFESRTSQQLNNPTIQGPESQTTFICTGFFHQKKIQKVLMKIEEMADVFLNSANFAPHAFLTLAAPSGYALNLKVLIKVSKVS